MMDDLDALTHLSSRLSSAQRAELVRRIVTQASTGMSQLPHEDQQLVLMLRVCADRIENRWREDRKTRQDWNLALDDQYGERLSTLLSML